MEKQKEKQTKKSKEQKSKPLYVKFCPKCKSLDVEISHQGFLSGLIALGVPAMYRCRNCGFSSNAFPEININEKHNKNNI